MSQMLVGGILDGHREVNFVFYFELGACKSWMRGMVLLGLEGWGMGSDIAVTDVVAADTVRQDMLITNCCYFVVNDYYCIDWRVNWMLNLLFLLNSYSDLG
mmetsp:Transcript_29968/g.28647  ORF Transcript_29968/g.28647 Transcript_29968/m.28647 type:complete len:101 (-) Transcript_29968:454-756(-)